MLLASEGNDRVENAVAASLIEWFAWGKATDRDALHAAGLGPGDGQDRARPPRRSLIAARSRHCTSAANGRYYPLALSRRSSRRILWLIEAMV